MFLKEIRDTLNNNSIYKLLLGIAFLFFVVCAPTVKQSTIDATSGDNTDNLFGKCATLANYDCLKKDGWSFQKVDLEAVRDTLSTRTVPIFQKMSEQFLQSYHQGDEVYYFSYPKIYWEKGMGRDGYCIIRNDSLVAEIVLTLN